MADFTPASRNFNYYGWNKTFLEKISVVEYIWIDGKTIFYLITLN